MSDKTTKSTDTSTKNDENNISELSPEDKLLKERLDSLVIKIQDSDKKLALESLKLLKEEIRSSTSSMTSVPKPLKFLKNNYETIKVFYNEKILTGKDKSIKVLYGDLMSVLAMVMELPETRQCLKYRLQSDLSEIKGWGAQYVKHLAAEIRMEMDERLEAGDDLDKLDLLISLDEIMKIVIIIVEFYMDNNSEPEACDILLEVEKLELIKKYCKKENHSRVCEYLRSCASYHPYPEDEEIYNICYDLYYEFDEYYNALRFALKLDKHNLVKKVMDKINKLDKNSNSELHKRQCGYLLGAHQYRYEENEDDDDEEEEEEDDDDDNDDDEDEDDEMPDMDEIISNSQLSEAFHNLARDLDVLDPKEAEQDIFKEQLLDNVQQQTAISARKSLAIAYVNAFVNAGYGSDKNMTAGTKIANTWLAKNKERGQMASVSSVGLLMLWDQNAVNTVDRYFESEHNYIRAGAYLAIGLACSGMRSEAGVGHALLGEPSLDKTKTTQERIAATLGLGLAYAGQENEGVYTILANLVSTEVSNELSSIAALSLGLVYVGTCNEEISNIILSDLMERIDKPEVFDDSLYIMNALGLGLIFLQRSEDVETTLEAVEVFSEINPKYCSTLKTTLEVLAYCGSGNVLKVQKLLSIVGEHYDNEKKDDDDNKESKSSDDDNNNNDDDDEKKKEEIDDYRYYQSIATIGIALLAMSEDLGSTMVLRMFDHLIQYGNIRVKRAVPLALGCLCVSNPKLEVSDVLSKLSHDHDDIVAQSAILALGLISGGTNNARIAGMLRNLTVYYKNDSNHLFLVRIAQGLTHMGKGLLTINPYHSDRFLLSKVALAGILTLIFNCIDMKNTILSDKHYLLYTLVTAMRPRMLVTLDSSLKALKTNVRVGQALDVVGIAGKPKSITGFQTHDTPVLLGYDQRGELATDDYISLSPILEGFVVLIPNPNSEKNKKLNKKNKNKNNKE